MEATNTQRVLVVSNEAHLTGAPKVALETLRALSSFRRIAAAKRGTNLREDFEAASDQFILRPMGFVEDWIPRARYRGLPTGTARLERSVARRVLDRVAPDLVYAHTVDAADYVAAAIDAGIPSVLHVHEGLETIRRFLGIHGISHRREPTIVVGCSRATTSHVRSVLGPGVSATTILEPTDAASVRRAAGGERPLPMPYVLSVGSVSARKGIDLWLDIAESMPIGSPRLVWAGIGPKLNWARRQIRRRRLADRVTLLGLRSDVPKLMRHSDALLLPSREEGLPLVAMEALTLGTPIAAFDVDGVAEVANEYGLLAPPEDVTALADRLGRVLGDSELRRRVREGGPAWVEHEFGIERFRKATQSLVERLLAGEPPRTEVHQ